MGCVVPQAVRSSIYGRPGACYVDIAGDMVTASVGKSGVRSVTSDGSLNQNQTIRLKNNKKNVLCYCTVMSFAHIRLELGIFGHIFMLVSDWFWLAGSCRVAHVLPWAWLIPWKLPKQSLYWRHPNDHWLLLEKVGERDPWGMPTGQETSLSMGCNRLTWRGCCSGFCRGSLWASGGWDLSAGGALWTALPAHPHGQGCPARRSPKLRGCSSIQVCPPFPARCQYCWFPSYVFFFRYLSLHPPSHIKVLYSIIIKLLGLSFWFSTSTSA